VETVFAPVEVELEVLMVEVVEVETVDALIEVELEVLMVVEVEVAAPLVCV